MHILTALSPIQRKLSASFLTRSALMVILLVNLLLMFDLGNWTFANHPWNPFWLLTGPALCLALFANGRRLPLYNWMHLLPFVLACLLQFVNKAYLPTFNQNMAIAACLFPYLCLIGYKLCKISEDSASSNQQVFPAFFAVAFGGIWFLVLGILDPAQMRSIGLDLRFLASAALVLALLFLLGGLGKRPIAQVQNGAYIQSQLSSGPRYVKTRINDDALENYLNQIRIYIHTEKHFLDPLMSPEKLAEDLCIPKHLISMIFNEHLGHRFYNYLAHTRIRYAIALIDSEDYSYKIETLSQQCGFSSPTSFYRHFRSVTKVSPYQYIQQKSHLK